MDVEKVRMKASDSDKRSSVSWKSYPGEATRRRRLSSRHCMYIMLVLFHAFKIDDYFRHADGNHDAIPLC